jgi:uncharacterized protein (DUF2235 family)
MQKNIVVCLDGTNNQYDATNTNVVKLYTMLDRVAIDQLSYYQPGIGTMAPLGLRGRVKRWFITRLDLAVAWLLEDHVTDAYRFLMRYYEDGDRIFLFGFSRGAYSARVLAAMLFKVGLLGKGNEELVSFAWDIFKRKRDLKLYRGFRRTFGRKVSVHFMGLWDTVSSVGWIWNPSHFQFTADNPIVRTIRHAVALDERRTYFIQNLWTGNRAGQDIVQVWYPGVHCDIGGGYIESEAGLPKLALKWIVDEAELRGLKINSTAKSAIIPTNNIEKTEETEESVAPDALGTTHESLHGFWWIPELIPKIVKDPSRDFERRLIWPRGRYRTVKPDALINVAVQNRRAGDSKYLPSNLPAKYQVVK